MDYGIWDDNKNITLSATNENDCFGFYSENELFPIIMEGAITRHSKVNIFLGIFQVLSTSSARVLWFQPIFPVLSDFVASGDLRPLFSAFGEIAQSRLDIIAYR